MRWLLVIALVVCAGKADAQVFKKREGKSAPKKQPSSESSDSDTPDKAAAKQSPKKERTAKKGKKGKKTPKDEFCEITDDDEIE